jgi:hypothetical protein
MGHKVGEHLEYHRMTKTCFPESFLQWQLPGKPPGLEQDRGACSLEAEDVGLSCLPVGSVQNCTLQGGKGLPPHRTLLLPRATCSQCRVQGPGPFTYLGHSPVLCRFLPTSPPCCFPLTSCSPGLSNLGRGLG